MVFYEVARRSFLAPVVLYRTQYVVNSKDRSFVVFYLAVCVLRGRSLVTSPASFPFLVIYELLRTMKTYMSTLHEACFYLLFVFSTPIA